jgi:alkylation response protein AidB-like acyl-CoA dehydrogenase
VEERIDRLLAECDPRTSPAEKFLGAQFDLGLAWVHFPEGRGGLGADPALQTVVDRRLTEVSAPLCFPRNPIGWGMAAPTIVTHGSSDQQDRYLRRLFTCEDIWCQLFSEPGAGSDVASLATTAVPDGDEWVINGQKVWTSLAREARYGMVLARSDPDKPKHRGLTYFVVDMHTPGVEVRPLRQITGDAEFNEVYFTDVRIPDSERLGARGEGWRAAITTLMNERVALGGGATPRNPILDMVLGVWRQAGAGNHGPVARERLAQLWIEAEVARFTELRARAARAQGTPGPEGSIGKLFTAELNQRLLGFAVNVLGPPGTLYPKTYDGVDRHKPDLQQAFLRAQANTIEGGTSAIMRNILGERVLGLPKEPDPYKGAPWREVPRN